ncbi:MAG: hypothetical protein M1832_000886 [Thelocarpon impressellum]|nr:MAG: hypothetical protein M1832_000886 [Thelocarpon impressellum]
MGHGMPFLRVPPQGDYGLALFAEPANPDVDIVFVHGLTGKRQSTWTHANGLCWPRDLLPASFPRARVLTFGYDADVVRLWGVPGANTLRDHGKSLAAAVATAREAAGKRRIVFIAHSLGGLVVEQALLLCKSSNESRLNRVLGETVGVIFMGTPHQGSHLAGWGQTAAKLVNYLRSTNDRIVGDLNPRSEAMVAVAEDFQQMLMSADIHIRVWCLYEEDSMPVVGKVVPDASAILSQYPSVSVKANHSDMTKFVGLGDPGFSSVRGIVRDWLQPEAAHPQLSMDEAALSDARADVVLPAADTQTDEGRPRSGLRGAQAKARGLDVAAAGSGGTVYLGAVDARDGSVVQGGQKIKGDVTMNFGSARK